MKLLLTLLLLLASAVAQTVPATEIRFKPGTTGAIAGAYRLVIDPVTFKLRCIAGGGADCMPAATGGGGGEGGGIITLNSLSDLVQTFSVANDTNVTMSINSVTGIHTFTLGWVGTLPKSRQHAQTAYYDNATNVFTNAITAPTFTGALAGNASTATALSADPNDCGANTFANAINTVGNLSCIAVPYASLSGTPSTFAPTAHDMITGHSTSGRTTGQVVRATGATTFAWGNVAYTELTGTPSTFAPAAHDWLTSHTTSGRSVGQVPRATSATVVAWGNVDYTELTGVPSSFTAAVHDMLTGHSTSGRTAGQVIRATGATTFTWGNVGAADFSTTGTRDGTKFLRDDNTWVTPGGGGTVTNFTAGTLAPLFTTSVATPTATPALTFTATGGIAQNAFLAGPFSGGTGAYSFRAINTADVPTLNQNTTGSAGSLSATLSCLQHPALTGGVTNSAGSCATTLAATAVQTNQSNTYSTGTQSFAGATSLVVPTAGGAAPTASGQVAFDSTKSAFAFGGGIGASSTLGTGYMPRFISFQNASTVLDSTTITTVETAFDVSYALPANFFSVGKILIVIASVQDVTPATAMTRSMRLRVQKTGPTNVNLLAVGTSTNTISVTRSTGVIVMIKCLTTGTTGTVEVIPVGNFNDAPTMVVNTITQPVTMDTTAIQTIQLTQTFGGTQTGGNTSQLRSLIVGELN